MKRIDKPTATAPVDGQPAPGTAIASDVAIDPEFLTPFGTAAKTHFVRANGLVAYYRAVGGFRRLE